MKSFIEYMIESTTPFDVGAFFSAHVQHGSHGTETKTGSLKDIKSGAKAQLAGAVRVFEEGIRRSGHKLTDQQHEAVRQHAYRILEAHFLSPNRTNHYGMSVKGATPDHASHSIRIGNPDRNDHTDLTLTSSHGVNHSTEVKSIHKPSLGDFTGTAQHGEVVRTEDNPVATRLAAALNLRMVRGPFRTEKKLQKDGTVKDVQTDSYKIDIPTSMKRTLLRRFERKVKRSGSHSITVVDFNPETPWNSTLVGHFGLKKGQSRLSDTDVDSWFRIHARSSQPAQKVSKQTGKAHFKRRYVQSAKTPDAFKQGIQQTALPISHLFKKN